MLDYLRAKPRGQETTQRLNHSWAAGLGLIIDDALVTQLL
jgi:hypothetical protein